MLMGNKLISSKGALKLCAEYDYIQQSTSFSFTPINEKRDIDDFEEIVKRTGFCIKLLHAQSVLADSLYFNIDYFICMESFLVHIGEHVFQIDPVIFSMNRILIITFEVIDFETGIPLNRDDFSGKMATIIYWPSMDINILAKKVQRRPIIKSRRIIYNNVSSFFSEMTGKNLCRRIILSFIIHLCYQMRLTFSDYFCNLIGVRELPSPLENISTNRKLSILSARWCKRYYKTTIQMMLIILYSMELYLRPLS